MPHRMVRGLVGFPAWRRKVLPLPWDLDLRGILGSIKARRNGFFRALTDGLRVLTMH